MYSDLAFFLCVVCNLENFLHSLQNDMPLQLPNQTDAYSSVMRKPSWLGGTAAQRRRIVVTFDIRHINIAEDLELCGESG